MISAFHSSIPHVDGAECPTCDGTRVVITETCRSGELVESSSPCPDCVEDDEREREERCDEDAECRWEVGL